MENKRESLNYLSKEVFVDTAKEYIDMEKLQEAYNQFISGLKGEENPSTDYLYNKFIKRSPDRILGEFVADLLNVCGFSYYSTSDYKKLKEGASIRDIEGYLPSDENDVEESVLTDEDNFSQTATYYYVIEDAVANVRKKLNEGVIKRNFPFMDLLENKLIEWELFIANYRGPRAKDR